MRMRERRALSRNDPNGESRVEISAKGEMRKREKIAKRALRVDGETGGETPLEGRMTHSDGERSSADTKFKPENNGISTPSSTLLYTVLNYMKPI